MAGARSATSGRLARPGPPSAPASAPLDVVAVGGPDKISVQEASRGRLTHTLPPGTQNRACHQGSHAEPSCRLACPAIERAGPGFQAQRKPQL